jgi:drug/metabolite transporter (DMT)-like permease
MAFVAIIFALAAAFSWGCSDFIGGLASRRLSVITVLLFVEVGGLLVMGTIALILQPEMMGATNTLMALGAGLVGVAGLGLFYKAMAIGTMSVVAPVAATGVILPIAVGVIGGERPSPLQWLGLAAVVLGIMLASREQTDSDAAALPSDIRFGNIAIPGAVALALLSALCFGSFFTLTEAPSEESVAWTVLLIRVAPVPVIIALWLRRGAEMPSGRLALGLMGAGTIDLAATAMIALANSRGDLSVVSVLASMYPVVTVTLAAIVLHERLLVSQYFGVVLALLGIGAVAGG